MAQVFWTGPHQESISCKGLSDNFLSLVLRDFTVTPSLLLNSLLQKVHLRISKKSQHQEMFKLARTVKKTLQFTTLSGEWRIQAAAFLRAEGGGGSSGQRGSCLPMHCSILPLPSKAPTQRGNSCLPPRLPG